MNRHSAMVWVSAVAFAVAGCKVAEVKRQEEVSRFKQYLQQQTTKLDPQVKKTLTMQECEQIAIANSLDLRLRQMQLKISDENVNLALTGALPKASVGYSDTTRSNSAGPGVSRQQQNAAVSATVPILDWGLTYYSYQIAKDQRKQDELLLRRTVQLLVRDVRQQYTKHAGAIRQRKMLEQAYQAGLEVLRVARNLEKAGQTVKADTALVEASVAQAEVELALAQKVLSETHIELSRLLSLPPGMEFSIVEETPKAPELPTEQDITRFEDRALAARPELAVQDLQRHVSAYDVRRQAAAFFPRVDGIGGFNWSGNNQLANQSWFFGGVQVSHGLLNGGGDIVRYSIAKRARDIETARTLLLSLGILYDVDLQALTVRENYEVLKAAGSLESARRAGLERIISLYKEGLEDEAGAARALADLTTQATALDRAQVAYLNAWYDLEATVVPEVSFFANATTTLPSTQPAPATVPTN